jgi:hypothetical protein
MMKTMLIFTFFILSSSLHAGAMSDIDLETREAIAYHLETDIFDAIHSLQFAPNQTGCYFTTQALIDDLICFVCFEGEGRDFYATKVNCQ